MVFPGKDVDFLASRSVIKTDLGCHVSASPHPFPNESQEPSPLLPLDTGFVGEIVLQGQTVFHLGTKS